MIEIQRFDGVVLATVDADSLCKANLCRANLCRANLIEANLCRANLIEANLCRANLCRANLIEANLCRANLIGANLCKADLCRANLYMANLCKADLIEANLIGAILPTGEVWEVYLAEVVPALLTAGGRPLSEVATEEAWACHSWSNCPMANAFGAQSEEECPILLRPRVQQFIQFFDAGLIPRPEV